MEKFGFSGEMKPLSILIILLLPKGNIMNEKIPQRNCKIMELPDPTSDMLPGTLSLSC